MDRNYLREDEKGHHTSERNKTTNKCKFEIINISERKGGTKEETRKGEESSPLLSSPLISPLLSSHLISSPLI
jgi:hypothetical protein